MDDLLHARTALEAAAAGFDPSACNDEDAIAIVKEIGSIRRLADGVLGKAAERVEDTAAYTDKNDRNAAELCQRLTGVSTGEAKRAIEVAAGETCEIRGVRPVNVEWVRGLLGEASVTRSSRRARTSPPSPTSGGTSPPSSRPR